MFLIFTPFTFIYFVLYIFFLLSLFTISNFYYFWVSIEFIMLLFIGIAYTLFTNGFSQLISYFLIQTLSSFILILSYSYSHSDFITLAILLKLSIFPFVFWYTNVMYRFPNFLLWLARTLHKVPVLLIIKSFSLRINYSLVWTSLIFTVLFRALIMLFIQDFRMLLILSSIGNNSWFILSQLCSNFIFLSFILFYSINFLILVSIFNSLSSISSSHHLFFDSKIHFLALSVISLSGLPPFPLFFLKIAVIYSIISTFGLTYLFTIFLVLNSLIVGAYIQSLIKYYINVYSSHLNYLLQY